MKYFIFAFMLAFSVISATPQAVITSLPDGRFEGSGFWTDAHNHSGSYETYYTIANNNLRIDTAWQGGSNTLNLSFIFSTTGALAISYNGSIVGTGQCNTVSCHFALTLGEASYQNTMFIIPGIFVDVGSKTTLGRTLRWQDLLQQL
jgi:hypothetical protein